MIPLWQRGQGRHRAVKGPQLVDGRTRNRSQISAPLPYTQWEGAQGSWDTKILRWCPRSGLAAPVPTLGLSECVPSRSEVSSFHFCGWSPVISPPLRPGPCFPTTFDQQVRLDYEPVVLPLGSCDEYSDPDCSCCLL